MKHSLKQLKLIALATVFCILANFSSQDESQTPNAMHVTNFFGIVTPLLGEPIKVENISISGLFDTIAAYATPANAETDPSVNTTRLRLSDILSITPIFVQDKPKILTFKGRDYIAIEVEFKDKVVKPYIIERSRQVFCFESFDALPKREFSFEGIKKLQIDGSTSRDRFCENENKLKVASNKFIGEFKKEINQVESEVTKNKLNSILSNFENETKEIIR